MNDFRPVKSKPKYSIGQRYMTRGKNSRACTIVEIYRTYNSKNELIKIHYSSVHDFLGQEVFNYDVCETTIAMGRVDE